MAEKRIIPQVTITTEETLEASPEKQEDTVESQDPRVYYYSAYVDMDSLINVRRGWDKYIVEPGTSGGTLIPPHFIPPPPNPSLSWSVYLDQNAKAPTSNK